MTLGLWYSQIRATSKNKVPSYAACASMIRNIKSYVDNRIGTYNQGYSAGYAAGLAAGAASSSGSSSS